MNAVALGRGPVNAVAPLDGLTVLEVSSFARLRSAA